MEVLLELRLVLVLVIVPPANFAPPHHALAVAAVNRAWPRVAGSQELCGRTPVRALAGAPQPERRGLRRTGAGGCTCRRTCTLPRRKRM